MVQSATAAIAAVFLTLGQVAPNPSAPVSQKLENGSVQNNESERNQAEIINRIREFARDALKSFPVEQRDAKLVEWLEDPLDVVKLATMGIVARRIADEGKRPEGIVLASLLKLIAHESPAVRREALLILQNLQDPVVVESVASRVAEERDPAIRPLVFQSLGKMGATAAVPLLIREIASPESAPESLREAALALGRLTSLPESKPYLFDSASPLLERYRATPTTASALRAALLSAMAGVADQDFVVEFVAALASEDVGVLQAGVRGLRELRDTSQLARCRELCSHSDPRVRLAAVEAVAALGSEDADIETLLLRISASVEPSELPRDAAWRGLLLLSSRRPIAERIQIADRLRATPDDAVRFLTDTATSLAEARRDSELDAVRDRLANLLIELGRETEAIPHLRELYTHRSAYDQSGAAAVGLRWLEAILRTPSTAGLGEALTRLASATSDPGRRGEIIQAVRQSIEAPTMLDDLDRAKRVVAELRAVSSELLGDDWVDMVQRFSRDVESRSPAVPVKPLP